jgi:hypothetical protein
MFYCRRAVDEMWMVFRGGGWALTMVVGEMNSSLWTPDFYNFLVAILDFGGHFEFFVFFFILNNFFEKV